MGNLERALSRREREVANLVAEGLTNRQIAERLFISERTAEGHVEQIRNKLGFTSRSQIAAWFVAGGGAREPADGMRRSNLPMPTAELIGRDVETDELAELVIRRRGVLTLTGPGGVGKTRLALAVAARLLDQFPDGVWLIDLAPLRHTEHIASTVARTLGLQPVTGRPLVTTIAASLRDRRVLLVLDNFEHLVEAGSLLNEILSKSPGSAVMVTSREALRLYGEQEYPVSPLAVGDGRRPGPAVQLFIVRAREIIPNLEFAPSELIAAKRICGRLDGLPLAIELAAARVRVLSPSTMLDRLETSSRTLTSSDRDVPARHQALAATFEWSHELLTGQEQILFRRLGVFRGGFTLEAAEAVCPGDGIASENIIDLLDSLAAKSLVRRDGPATGARFGMLETVRDFARAKLETSPDANNAKLAHMRFFIGLAERERPLLKTEEELESLARLDAELPNLRAAIEQSREAGDAECELRLVAALWFYWHVRESTHEGLQWLNASPLDDERISADLRAEAMIGQGRLRLTEGDADRAARIGLSLQKLASSCSVPGRVMGWGKFLTCHQAFNEPARIRSLADESVPLLTRYGDAWEQALANTMLGEVERTYGSPAAAATTYERAIRLLRDHGGEHLLTAINHHNLAQTSLLLGDLQTASEQFHNSLQVARGLGAVKLALYSLVGLANVAQAHGRPIAAARWLGCADAEMARMGYEFQPADKRPRDRLEAALRAVLGDAAYAQLHAQGGRLEPDEVIARPEVLEAAPDPDFASEQR